MTSAFELFACLCARVFVRAYLVYVRARVEWRRMVRKEARLSPAVAAEAPLREIYMNLCCAHTRQITLAGFEAFVQIPVRRSLHPSQ
eukprot:COSAG01_NODE_6882_length_3453_cov_28.777877_1_plen_86_part_10